MKKSLVVFVLVLMICLCAAIALCAGVESTRDEVAVEEIALIGEASAAAGLKLNIRSNWDNHLFWEYPHSAGQGGIRESAYRVSAEPDYGYAYGDYYGINLTGNTAYPRDETVIKGGEGLTGIALAFHELYKMQEPGEYRVKKIKLSDYLDYYPLDGQMNLPGLDMHLSDPSGDWESEFNNEEGWRTLSQYFRIPVLDDEIMEISMGMDENGGIASMGTHRGSISYYSAGDSASASESAQQIVLEGDSYDFYTISAVFPDAVYFTINNRSSNGKIIDTSLIPGGYGIYRLPYSLENGEYTVSFDELSTVKSLDEELKIQNIFPDMNNEKLIMLAYTQGEQIMYVIDAATMETEQSLVLAEISEESYWQYYVGGNYIAFVNSNVSLALAERQENGEYILCFNVNLGEARELCDIHRVEDMAWDGQRLAIAGFKALNNVNEYHTGDFYYAVFTAEGLQCFVDCDSSLCINGDSQWEGVRYGYDDSMDLYWE